MESSVVYGSCNLIMAITLILDAEWLN